jgi:regulator of protease activity HflC (stomatin/prohibitin superfamily)
MEIIRGGRRGLPFKDQWNRLSFKLGIGLFIALLLGTIMFFTNGMVIVERGEAAILIRKTGTDLPDGQIIALKEGQKGIQLDPIPEGWYWYNPYTWDWITVRQVTIKPGEVAIKVSNFGKDLPPGRVIAGEGEKGIMSETLRPGRYMINTLAFSLIRRRSVTIRAGHVGVVTRLSGSEPKNPNEFLVEKGERGVQRITLRPGTYYPHPFIQKIVEVDTRSHRFDMMGKHIIHFPSLDGFDITMESTIEWYVDPERVAEVYVKYVDTRPVIECVVEKVILPYARAFSRIEGSKHLAREFIEGETRQKFQNKVTAGLKKACAKQGVIIQSALVRDTLPPEEISRPIREREIAIRNASQYQEEKKREKQQKLLSMEEKIKDRNIAMKLASANVSVATTKANQLKEVAVIEVSRKLEVAKLELEAAQNEADATVAKGQAEADVIKFKNYAEAQGLAESVAAFGSGDTYVRYLINQKIAPSISYILSNTDGPFLEIFKKVSQAGVKKEDR